MFFEFFGAIGVFKFKVDEPLLNLFVDIESEVKDRDDFIAVCGVTAKLGISSSACFPGGLVTGPKLSARSEAGEEVTAAEFVDEICLPPTKTRFFVGIFSGPGDGELEAEDVVEEGVIEANASHIHE